ncbi:CotO family spore coat protein [Virgibacillus sp. W0181]|uniref:CotO family spore coat protein n=1 Tax=Virgibacillus sp. W0181 TaxID=3391581 RepID=UPI003F4723F8
MGKQYAKNPLLYIHQPERKAPKAKMQESYTSTSVSKSNQTSPYKATSKKKSRRHSYSNPLLGANRGDYSIIYDAVTKGYETVDNTSYKENETDDHTDLTETGADTEGKEKPEDHMKETDTDTDDVMQTKKKFSDLSLDEKINYFINRPRFAPEVKCELKTEEKVYKGVIVHREGQQVFIRVGNRKSSTQLSIEDIMEINLIGF